MKKLEEIKIIENNNKKFKFLFPDSFFYYSCKNCLINCCTRNDKILLHKEYKSNYSSYFKENHNILNLGVCPQLRSDGKCRIEVENGKYAKPDICNIFPYKILGKLDDVYIVSINLYDCSITNYGDTPVTIKNFFEQTRNINFDFYNYIPRDNLSDYEGYNYNNKNLTEFFEQNYKLTQKEILYYWKMWNDYYQKAYNFPEQNYLIAGFENSFLINKNPYSLLTPIEKIALLYLLLLFENISNKKIDSHTFMKIIKTLRNTIKILTSFNKLSVFNKKLDMNSEYFMDIATIYQYNKKYSLNESLNKIAINDKGSFLIELARFI